MATIINATYVGEDDFHRALVLGENGRYYCADENDNGEYDWYSCTKDYHEPISPIEDFDIELHITGLPEPNQFRFQYMLLSRMQADCKAALYRGNTARSYFTNKPEAEEFFAEMRRLWNVFPPDKKPEWCTSSQIDEYEKTIMSNINN